MNASADEEHLSPPSRLFERLRQIAGYSWDESNDPYHSSYDNWNVLGRKDKLACEPLPTPSNGGFGKSSSPLINESNAEETQAYVVAKISDHTLREERAYSICKNLIGAIDRQGDHIAKPVDLVRLPAEHDDGGHTMISIFEYDGPNALEKYMDFGPAWYKCRKVENACVIESDTGHSVPIYQISLPTFLEFAIGAIECLEILHYGQRIVHGEIRGDAFHFNETTGQVRLVNFGSGLRSFEHGLTSSGWSTLSQEPGARTKLSYISPEQTGRMPAEPDSRTDIYSLGILFWVLLTQQPAFDGPTPMDIIQGVLRRQLPSVSSVRNDIPDVLDNVISKMTAKSIGDRYHSASGLHHDLIEIQNLLSEGNSEALKNWKIATKDVSSFFILPSIMVGRIKERNEIVKIIETVAKRHLIYQKQGVYNLSSGSHLIDVDASSVSGDSFKEWIRKDSVATPSHSPGDPRTSDSSNSVVPSTPSSQHLSFDSQDSAHSHAQMKCEKINNLSSGNKSFLEGVSVDSEGQRGSSEGVGSLTTLKNHQKFRRKGHCEVISISGAAGLGKSCLVQSVQVEARRRGYFASSKFDRARSTPFGPVLKLLSSLFRQVFSENSTETQFHEVLKHFVRPAWPMLHQILNLPEFLLGPSPPNLQNQILPSLEKNHWIAHNKSGQSSALRGFHPGFRRRESSPSSSRSSPYNFSLVGQGSQDFLRAGSSTKLVRLMNTFLDVLRVFALHKFICFCLDDLQFADDESLELISQIISSRIKLVVIVTYRPDEIFPEKIKNILEPTDAEGIRYLKERGTGVTYVNLQPLSEDDISQYVATTLCRPVGDIIPLTAVIQAKTNGNPFYMREFLDTCHRKNCIWYDYRERVWHYNLDRIFPEFSAENYHDVLGNDFVIRRLRELPSTSRAILSWASLIGNTFSFQLIQRLLSEESYCDDEAMTTPDTYVRQQSPLYSQDTVAGLQACIQARIVIPTEDDDRFRFTHDRYIQAASCLGQEVSKMHFTIVQTLLKYYPADERSRVILASHACESIDIIKSCVTFNRQPLRKVLLDCAQKASENGARQTAAKYYTACLDLLQEDPWDDDATDAYYDETLSLYIRAVECFQYVNRYQDAMNLLSTIFLRARTPIDKAPASILQSRLHAQQGDSSAAFQALKSSLLALGIMVEKNPTFDKCDAEFERLSLKIQSLERHELIAKMPKDSNLATVGAVLVEIVSTAFWSDQLTFYSMSLAFLNTYLKYGAFPQCGLGFLYLASIAMSRFNMMSFANEMGNISLELMERWGDHHTLGRGNNMYSLFVGHIQSPLSVSLSQLEGALEYTIQAGDRLSTILNFGIVALLKFYSSEHLSELELFCQYGPEEVSNWQYDYRGGTILIAVCQVCRALQGKTMTSSPDHVISDEGHNTALYFSWIKTTTVNHERPIWIYLSLEIAPLFLYGHYEKAVEIGRQCMGTLEDLWSMRSTRFAIFYYGLALSGLVWRKIDDPLSDTDGLQDQISSTLKELKLLQKKIVDWQVINDVNYAAWSKMLESQVSELEQKFDLTLTSLDESMDHAAANNFVLEEALANYLLAGFFLRRGARRPAKAALRETITLFRQIGATGVVKHIEEQHNLLLLGQMKSFKTIDVAVQTESGSDTTSVQYGVLADERQQAEVSTGGTKGDQIGAWQGGTTIPATSAGLPALDMLDLTSILESSQVISSVLQVDQLLTTMCEIILQNCGGVATLAAIIMEENDSSPVWTITASGSPENGATAHIPGLSLSKNPAIEKSVILYCARFRETVFLPDFVRDERFSNVTDDWWEQNPIGKSIIAIPITHGAESLLGVLYLQGRPNAFTGRNLTVLQLLVNQIGISYSNALTLKAIEKVSASNISIVQSQKRALAKAKEAETKAKRAEAEALRNVKLAEEAARAKSIFLANVSHELRTPLNGVIGNSELLRASGELTKEQAEMSDSIRISADLLLTVINDILDFSKMEADRMELFNVAFNPDEMLREVVRSMSYSSQAKKMKNVEIKRDFNLPQTLVYGDPVRLHQVLGNLIGNSLKFTERGTITVGAKVDGEADDAVTLTFWIKDTGIGIPPSQLSKLFKPFSQADASTARKYGGSGLGLSICKSLIETMMHGKIELESQERIGTTVWFTVTFPKADAQASVGDSQNSAEERDPMAKYIEQGVPDTQGVCVDVSIIPREELRICIAEDNQINQKIAIQFVQKLGFKHVDAYDNGLEAVEGLRRKSQEGRPYHLVLMDCQMPVMDGYESTKLIRRDENEAVRSVLVIAMTASAIQGDREKCLESGMNDYLAKPVRVQVLKKKLEEYLCQKKSPLQPDLEAEANTDDDATADNVDGAFGATTAAPLSLGSSALHQSYHADYGFNKALSVGGKRPEINGSTNHVNIVNRDIWPRFMTRREEGMGAHNLSGLSISMLPSNHDGRVHGVQGANGE